MRDVDIPTQEPSLEETRALLQANLFRHELITPDLLAAYHQMSIGRNFTNAVRRAEAAAGGGKGGGKPLWQRLGEVTVPLLFIYGANDRGKAAERILLARETYPQLMFQLLDGCHHILQWDRADDVVRSIGGFLAGLPIKGRDG
jgi:pimeloyl-ACP methyl ester carboxylesterase